MRFLKYFLLIAVLALPLAYSQAQVSFGVQVGGPVYYGTGYGYGPPVCPYGYYDYSPYECAPYGYWGPEWFDDGLFIGVGPWYHYYYSHPAFYYRIYGGRYHHRDWDRDRGGFARERERFGDHDGFHRFDGGRGGNFQGNNNFRGGGNFQGGGNFRGGNGGGPRFEGGPAQGGGNRGGGNNQGGANRSGGSMQGGGNRGGGGNGGGGNHGGGGGHDGGHDHNHR
jgi:hypothetical protein